MKDESRIKNYRKIRKYNKVSFFAPEKKRLRVMLLIIFLIVLLITGLLSIVKDNLTIAVREIDIGHPQIPSEFDNYRILQISDINGAYFGVYQEKLLRKISALSYDIVIMTGDYLSDPNTDDYRPVLDLLEFFRDKGIPVYYVLGERDYSYASDSTEDFISFNPTEKNDLMQEMEKYGACFVYPIQEILRGESKIFLTGTKFYENAFANTTFDMDRDFSICVTHVPIKYNVTSRLTEVNAVKMREVDYDLSISGHTLGGIIRLPILGAAYSSDSGLFPQEKNTYGLHQDAAGRLNYITSGLGTTETLPFRVMNTPEITVLTLRYEK